MTRFSLPLQTYIALAIQKKTPGFSRKPSGLCLGFILIKPRVSDRGSCEGAVIEILYGNELQGALFPVNTVLLSPSGRESLLLVSSSKSGSIQVAYIDLPHYEVELRTLVSSCPSQAWHCFECTIGPYMVCLLCCIHS